MNDIIKDSHIFSVTIKKGPKINCRIDCIPFSNLEISQFKKDTQNNTINNAEEILSII